MATLPTAAEKGRLVLNAFKHFSAKPGHALQGNNFVSYAAKNGLQPSDMADGIEFGVVQGWFEEGPNGGTMLTDAGFAAM